MTTKEKFDRLRNFCFRNPGITIGNMMENNIEIWDELEADIDTLSNRVRDMVFNTVPGDGKCPSCKKPANHVLAEWGVESWCACGWTSMDKEPVEEAKTEEIKYPF